jgi:methionine sulfoxide reductase heme-binding subunit
VASVSSTRTSSLKALLQRGLLHPWAKTWVALLCALPGLWLVYGAFTQSLGVNPAETLIRQTGDLTIRALCYVLLVTPLKDLLSMPALLRHRRTLGLAVLAYASIHLLCYAWLDMGLEVEDILNDVLKRPFIFVGMAGFVLLMALGGTSFNAAIKAMGPKRWKRLHQAVYGIAGLAVLHFYWMRAGKHRFDDVIFYGGILALLLLYRGVMALRQRKGSVE